MVLNGSCKIQTSGHNETQKQLKQILNLSLKKGERNTRSFRTASDENKIKVRKLFEIDKTRYSSFKKYLRVTVYVNQFINHIKNKRKIDKELTANKINRVELIWIKYIQGKHYLSNKRQLNEKQTESTQPKNTLGWSY